MAANLLEEILAAGLNNEAFPAKDRLEVWPSKRLTNDLRAAIREHKAGLLRDALAWELRVVSAVLDFWRCPQDEAAEVLTRCSGDDAERHYLIRAGIRELEADDSGRWLSLSEAERQAVTAELDGLISRLPDHNRAAWAEWRRRAAPATFPEAAQRLAGAGNTAAARRGITV